MSVNYCKSIRHCPLDAFDILGGVSNGPAIVGDRGVVGGLKGFAKFFLALALMSIAFLRNIFAASNLAFFDGVIFKKNLECSRNF